MHATCMQPKWSNKQTNEQTKEQTNERLNKQTKSLSIDLGYYWCWRLHANTEAEGAIRSKILNMLPVPVCLKERSDTDNINVILFK